MVSAADRLRVAILTRVVYPLHPYGGLERSVFDLVNGLLARGANVTLITKPRDRNRPRDDAADAVFASERLTLITVPYYTFPLANRRGTTILDRVTAYPWFGWRAGRVAAELAAAGRVDIVHAFGASGLGYAAYRRRNRSAPPLVLNPQGMEEFGATDPSSASLKRVAYFPLQRAVLACARAADRVIATDRALVEPLLRHLRVEREKVCIIPNAIDLAALDRQDARERAAALRASVHVEPGDPLLLSVGRLEANKGFDVLVRALGALVRDRALPVRWRWVLIGEGPMREALVREIAAQHLEQHAILQGTIGGDELGGWYEAADLFVHPTRYEGSSLVTLEAMSHRRPIVATKAGGLPDKVQPGANGWLVAPGDANALADAIRTALADRQAFVRMGAMSRTIVEREFSWSVALDRLLGVYGALMSPAAT